MSPAQILVPLAIAVAIQTLLTFANLSATTLAPEILRDLALPGGAANAYVVILYTTATVASFVAAGIVLKMGPIRVCQAALLIVLAGALLVYSAPTAVAIAAAAVLFGLAYTTPIPAGAQILVENTPSHLRNTLFGVRQIGVPAGGLAAGLLFPPMAEAFGWQAAFAATAAACLALMVILQAFRKRYDGGRQPDIKIWRSSGHGPIAVLRSAPALKPLCIAGVLFAGTEVAAVANIVIFLERDLGWTLVRAGYALSALSAGGAIGRFFWGLAADRIERRGRLLGLLGFAMAASMTALGFGSFVSPPLAFVAAFAVGFTAGGWTGVGIAESARLAGPAGPVAGAATLTQMMFLGVVALPLLVGLALAAGLSFAYVLTGVGALAGLGGCILLFQPEEA